MDEISTKKELADITLLIDRYISSVMGRAATFVHRRAELVCESISRSAAAQPLDITIPLEGDSPLHQPCPAEPSSSRSQIIRSSMTCIYSQIGEPADRQIVVVPFKCLGRVLAVTYGDFGSRHRADSRHCSSFPYLSDMQGLFMKMRFTGKNSRRCCKRSINSGSFRAERLFCTRRNNYGR